MSHYLKFLEDNEEAIRSVYEGKAVIVKCLDQRDGNNMVFVNGGWQEPMNQQAKDKFNEIAAGM